MQMVGPRPLIWHVMRYYAQFGHEEFILYLGSGVLHMANRQTLTAADRLPDDLRDILATINADHAH